MKSPAFQGLLYFPDGYSHYIDVPDDAWEIIEKWPGQRVILILNGIKFHRVIRKFKDLPPRISVSKPMLKELKVETGDIIQVTVEQDMTEFQAEMPEELAAVLETDLEGFERFMKLTDGAKRSAMFAVLRVKNTQSRIDKALKIVENIRKGATRPEEFMR